MAGIWALVLGAYSATPSRVKKGVAVLGVFAVVFMAGDMRGSRIEKAKCEALAKRAANAVDAQDLQAEKDGRAQDLDITNALVNQKKVDDETITKLEAQLRGKGGTPCVYDKSTADAPDPRRVRR